MNIFKVCGAADMHVGRPVAIPLAADSELSEKKQQKKHELTHKRRTLNSLWQI